METGTSSSTIRVGGATGPVRVVEAAFPQDGGPRSGSRDAAARKSTRCPSIRSAARISVAATSHDSSVPMTVRAPPDSISSCARKAVCVPYMSASRVNPNEPRNQPSVRTARTVLAPARSNGVTSKAWTCRVVW